MSVAVMVVMASQMHTHPQTHQILYINMYSFLHVNHTSKKAFKKK